MKTIISASRHTDIVMLVPISINFLIGLGTDDDKTT